MSDVLNNNKNDEQTNTVQRSDQRSLNCVSGCNAPLSANFDCKRHQVLEHFSMLTFAETNIL